MTVPAHGPTTRRARVPLSRQCAETKNFGCSIARNFKELQAKMSREARVRSEEAAKKVISEMGLAELREAMDLTQETLADTLHVKQASISKMERRSDLYISTLRKIIKAMGGELQIIANMPNGRVQIRQFTKIRKGD